MTRTNGLYSARVGHIYFCVFAYKLHSFLSRTFLTDLVPIILSFSGTEIITATFSTRSGQTSRRIAALTDVSSTSSSIHSSSSSTGEHQPPASTMGATLPHPPRGATFPPAPEATRSSSPIYHTSPPPSPRPHPIYDAASAPYTAPIALTSSCDPTSRNGASKIRSSNQGSR